MSARCDYISECGLFEGRLADLPGLAAMFKARYCESTPERCMRHAVARERGASAVPDALMPNDAEQARGLAGVGVA